MKFAYIALIGLLFVGCAFASQAQCEAGAIEGYFPHSVYCNKFYSCSLGYWREMTCYGEGVWNSAGEYCDYRENVNCGNLVSESRKNPSNMDKLINFYVLSQQIASSTMADRMASSILL